MSWGKRTCDGVEYDFSHLDSRHLKVLDDYRKREYHVLITYGHHCFARERTTGDSEEMIVTHPNGLDPRCICPVRTKLSLHLPQIFAKAATGLAYFSQDKKMLLVEEIEGLTGPYAVFFDIKQSPKHNIDAAIFVASAYEKVGLPERLPAVTFVGLVGKAAIGQTPQRPLKTKSWKSK